jgi:hypothetical protein
VAVEDAAMNIMSQIRRGWTVTGAMRAAQPEMPAPQTQGILKSRASCPGRSEKPSHTRHLRHPSRCPARCPQAAWGILHRVGASGGIWLAGARIAQANQGRDPDAPRCPGGPGEGIWPVSGDATAMRAAQSSNLPLAPAKTRPAERPVPGAAARRTHPKMPSVPKVSCPRRASLAAGTPERAAHPFGIIEKPGCANTCAGQRAGAHPKMFSRPKMSWSRRTSLAAGTPERTAHSVRHHRKPGAPTACASRRAAPIQRCPRCQRCHGLAGHLWRPAQGAARKAANANDSQQFRWEVMAVLAALAALAVLPSSRHDQRKGPDPA